MNNWTDELFDLMVEKMVARKRAEIDAIKGVSRESVGVSPETLASMSHGSIKVVRKQKG